MSLQTASEHRLNLAATLRNLWGLVGYAGAAGRRAVITCIAVTALAATSDAASLALLKQTLGMPALAQNAGLRTAAIFLLAALVGSGLRLVAQRLTVTAQFTVGNALSFRAFKALQQQNYAEYLNRGPSEAFAAFERLQTVVNFGLNPLIAGAAALFSALVILLGIALLYPLATALIALALVAIALETARHRHVSRGTALSSLARMRAALLYEARTAFRHIYLANGQARMCEDFNRTEAHYRGEQAKTTIASQSSRHTIEIAGLLVALIVLGILALHPLPGAMLVPLLGVTALATFRLVPQIAGLRSSIRLITLHAAVTEDLRELLEHEIANQPEQPEPQLAFRGTITLEGVSLSRPDRPMTLANLDLMIERGQRIGIRGESGVGKSSLLDVLCGAIEPGSGVVRIDSTPLDPTRARAWRERIGVVSQNPVLLGTTLREAIVFPERLEDTDPERMIQALAAAGVEAMAAPFPLGLDTPVGEASSLLSGGQRQRIALAHALYRARDLLILDEATGQLDVEGERAIVAAVEALPRDLTIVVASHRPAVFDLCDIVYRLERGRLVRAD